MENKIGTLAYAMTPSLLSLTIAQLQHFRMNFSFYRGSIPPTNCNYTKPFRESRGHPSLLQLINGVLTINKCSKNFRGI